MTSDIIQKLRALITPDENGLWLCPVCNKQVAGEWQSFGHGNSSSRYVIKCHDCIKSEMPEWNGKEDYYLYKDRESIKAEIRAWNTRAYVPLIEEAIKELEAKDE